MTPQEEKARALVFKYEQYKWITDDLANQSALIAVDEILKASPSAPIEPFGGRINLGECCNLSKAYWQEVRKEIEKL